MQLHRCGSAMFRADPVFSYSTSKFTVDVILPFRKEKIAIPAVQQPCRYAPRHTAVVFIGNQHTIGIDLRGVADIGDLDKAFGCGDRKAFTGDIAGCAKLQLLPIRRQNGSVSSGSACRTAGEKGFVRYAAQLRSVPDGVCKIARLYGVYLVIGSVDITAIPQYDLTVQLAQIQCLRER